MRATKDGYVHIAELMAEIREEDNSSKIMAIFSANE